jgi:predicted histone-like DNA-binding protein
MSVKFAAVARRDPIHPNVPSKFYPVVRITGHSNLRRIATRISKICSMSSADTLAILEALLDVIPEELAIGHTVSLGDFGSYRLSVRGSGEEIGDDVTYHNILKTRAIFKPGKLFRQALANMEYEKEALPTPPPEPEP